MLRILATAPRRETRLRLEAHDAPLVFIVDSDATTRRSLDVPIRSAGWSLEGHATGQSFLSRPKAQVPSCLILDLDLPDLDGLDLQRIVAVRWAEIPVIFVSSHADVTAAVRAMKAGAVEFFLKPFSSDTLLTAIEQALDRSRAALRDAEKVQAARRSYALLTAREKGVMGLVVSGLLNKQVAFELGISEITVKAHRGQVMRKMKARSLLDLVSIASRLGLTH